MATLQTAITFARKISGANSASLSDSSAIAFATDALYESRKAFIKNGVDAGQIQESYFTPTAGIGAYNYPTSPQFLVLKAIETNFQGPGQTNYVQANHVDVSNLPPGTSFDWLRVNQSATTPLYNDHGNSYEIFPTPQASMNLTAAVKIIYFIQPTPYVATTDTLVYPETIDPNILGYGIAALQLQTQFKFQEAQQFQAKMMDRIVKAVAMLGMQGQTPTQPQGVALTGYEF